MLTQLRLGKLISGLSSPGILFQFKDFPGFSRPVDTVCFIKYNLPEYRFPSKDLLSDNT